MPSSHARSPFLISAGNDAFLGEPAVHVGCGPQRWVLTPCQARELARSLLHAVRHLDAAPRLSVGDA